MLKARKESDGQIKIYGSLPSKFKGKTGNYAGGFHKVNTSILESEGFFDVVIPEYNKTIETLSDIYFDEINNIYTYDILDRTDLPSIDDAKINKIKELKERAKEKFNETDWYYIREMHAGKNGKNKKVPDSIVLEREAIYDLIDKKEQEINDLTDLELILNFDTNLFDIKKVEEITPEEPIVEEVILEEPIEEPITDIPVGESELIPESPLVEPSVSASDPIPEPPVVGPSVSALEPIPEPPVVGPSVSASDPIPEPPVVGPSVSASDPIPETPIETPVETPIEAPIETPAEIKVETPIDVPVETPAENPIENTVEIIARALKNKKSQIIAKAISKNSTKKSKKTLAKKSTKKNRRA